MRLGIGFFCSDCGLDTFSSNLQEYYMVRDIVWNRAKLGSNGFLCIGCLENRLGRQLTSKDFKRCRLNNYIKSGTYPASHRLRNRILTRAK